MAFCAAYRARHRFQQRPTARGAHPLVHRHANDAAALQFGGYNLRVATVSTTATAHFHEIPINAPIAQVHNNNNQRDGMHRQAIPRGRVAYEPNSLKGWSLSPGPRPALRLLRSLSAKTKVRGKPREVRGTLSTSIALEQLRSRSGTLRRPFASSKPAKFKRLRYGSAWNSYAAQRLRGARRRSRRDWAYAWSAGPFATSDASPAQAGSHQITCTVVCATVGRCSCTRHVAVLVADGVDATPRRISRRSSILRRHASDVIGESERPRCGTKVRRWLHRRAEERTDEYGYTQATAQARSPQYKMGY